MGKVRRIRIRGKRRKHPDAALVAQAIIQLGREIWQREQQEQSTDASSKTQGNPAVSDDEANS